MKILIADDHRLVIDAVQDRLAEVVPGAVFVIAKTVDDLLALADDTLDLAIVDLNMPGAQGHAHVDQLLGRHPAVPVIVLSGFGGTALVQTLLARGVRGFIPKAYSSGAMASAVRQVLDGGVYMPPALPGGDAQNLPETPPGPAVPRDAPAPTLESLRGKLTQRQIEALQLLSQGKPNKLIARELNISEGTVKIHLAAIFRVLNAHNRTEAVIYAQQITGAALPATTDDR